MDILNLFKDHLLELDEYRDFMNSGEFIPHSLVLLQQERTEGDVPFVTLQSDLVPMLGYKIKGALAIKDAYGLYYISQTVNVPVGGDQEDSVPLNVIAMVTATDLMQQGIFATELSQKFIGVPN